MRQLRSLLPLTPARVLLLGLLASSATAARGEDEKKLDFQGFADDFIEEKGLSTTGLTFQSLIDGELFARIPLAAFDVRYPVDALADGENVETLQEALTALLDVQETWFAWCATESVPKDVVKHWKTLRKWVGDWSARKLGKCHGGEPSLHEQLGADEKVIEALTALRDLTRPPKETIDRVGDLNLTVIAPSRKHFLEICAIAGLCSEGQRGTLWSDKLINQTAAWHDWTQILALTNAAYPFSYEHPFNEEPKTANDETAMRQYIADRAGVAMCRKEFNHHGTGFFEQALVTNLVIEVAGRNGQFTQGEWQMQWSRAGASTQPYTRFVPGGNPNGGILPARRAIPGPLQMSITMNGVELSKYRTDLGEDFFSEVLREGQQKGYELASKDRDNPRRKDKAAHFEIYSNEIHEATYVTAPFLGEPAEGKQLPPDAYLDAYEDFFRAYRACFLDWLRKNGASKESESFELFGALITQHAARAVGDTLDAIVERIYPLPLSSKDPEVETLESRFLEWLRKG